MNRHERRKAKAVEGKERPILQKDLDWLRQWVITNVGEAKDKLWISSWLIIHMDGEKKIASLLYDPPFECGQSITDSSYSLRLFQKLGWTVRQAHSIEGNYVPNAPGFGETYYYYEELPDYTWSACQILHAKAYAKLGKKKCEYSDTKAKDCDKMPDLGHRAEYTPHTVIKMMKKSREEMTTKYSMNKGE